MYHTSQLRSRTMRTLTAAAAVAVALLANTAHAQTTRWQPYVGCWTPSNAATTNAVTPISSNMASPNGSPVHAAPVGLLCVAPTNGGSEVDLATIVNGKVAHLEHISATGTQMPKTVDNCPGWESATWSEDNQRVFLRSEFRCGASAVVKGSGMFAISSDGQFVQIQGSTVNGNTGARAIRYEPAGVQLAMKPGTMLSDSSIVETVPQPNGMQLQTVRAAAGAPATTRDIIDVSKHVDVAVAGAWLNELGQRFAVNGKELVTLADAGVPPYMIDLMVALSYPERYAIRRSDGTTTGGASMADNSRRSDNFDDGSRSNGYWDCGYGARMLAFGYYGGPCNAGYSTYDPYGFGYGYGYGYNGYGYNPYYYGNRPVVIITRGDAGNGDGSTPVQGRAVKGQGYTHTGGSSATNDRSPRSAPASTSSGSSGASTGSSGSSGAEPRTAKPRTPPPIE
jgi:hypothetical protein